MKTYKKPVVTVDAGMAEGIYAASGAKGTLNVVYHGVWDRWGTNGGNIHICKYSIKFADYWSSSESWNKH